MKIEEFLSQGRNIQPFFDLLRKVWDEKAKENRWPTGRTKITREAVNAALRGQMTIESEMGENPKWSLETNIRLIASQWNWKRTPAPLQLLQSDKLWKGILQNLMVDAQEKDMGNTESLISALKWLENQVRSRKSEWAAKPTISKAELQEKLRKEIPEAATALGRLRDLSGPQLAEWNQELEDLTSTL